MIMVRMSNGIAIPLVQSLRLWPMARKAHPLTPTLSPDEEAIGGEGAHWRLTTAAPAPMLESDGNRRPHPRAHRTGSAPRSRAGRLCGARLGRAGGRHLARLARRLADGLGHGRSRRASAQLARLDRNPVRPVRARQFRAPDVEHPAARLAR